MNRLKMVVAALLIPCATSLGAQAADSTCQQAPGPLRIALAFDELRVCVFAQNYDSSAHHAPREWIARSPRSLMETARPGDVRRMEIIGSRVIFTVNGVTAPADAAADSWRNAMQNVIDTSWASDDLRRTSTALRLDLATMPARRDSMRAVIDVVGQLAAKLNGRIQAVRTQEAALQRSVSAAEAQSRRIDNDLSRARTDLSALYGSRTANASAISSAEARVKSLEEQQRRQDETTRSLQRQLDNLNADRTVVDAEESLRNLNADHRIAFTRMQLAEIDSVHEGDVRAEIASLDVETRSAELQAALNAAVARLKRLLDGEP